MYLTGTEGDDILVGTADADTILGLGGADTLHGGDGDDLLIGGAGQDVLDGGAGSDTVSYEDADPPPMFSFLMINLSGQYVSIIGLVGASLDTLASIENAIGSNGNDWFVSSAGDHQMFGGAGDDRFDGKGGADVMDGGDGNDALSTTGIFGAAAPGSLMIGGGGNDQIWSGNSNDTMLGGAGDDILSVENYAVTRVVDGGTGTDTLAFLDGFTAFAAGVIVDLGKGTQLIAPDVVVSITGVENLTGSAAGDILVGDAIANQLRGGAGNDSLFGREDNDVLLGEDGDDYLAGGTGQDALNGGAGADTFSFLEGDTPVSAPDTIVSFTAEDHIAFGDSPDGSGANYAELETMDGAAIDALFAAEGVRYVTAQFGSSVFLFADAGDEGTSYDQLVILTGTSLSSIDAGSILGL